MNSLGCITQTTVSVVVAGSYKEPPVAAPSAVRNTTLVVVVVDGTFRGFQSVFKNPAVLPAVAVFLLVFMSILTVLVAHAFTLFVLFDN